MFIVIEIKKRYTHDLHHQLDGVFAIVPLVVLTLVTYTRLLYASIDVSLLV